jgi:NAD(P)-dependent dehydrogenase (short-subunit alcohol dehydrogenase family)
MARSYEGKVVLVTGASSGIGEATAVAFMEAGATVFGLARRQQTLEAVRARHPRIRWVAADVAQRAQIVPAVESVVREGARLDVVVNNAALFFFAPLERSSEEQIRSQFEINVYGTTFVTQAALPALKQSRGSIVNISSAAGHKPTRGGAHYGATKAAVESLTRSWALELAPHGIRVNAVAPGPVDTPGFDKGGDSPERISAVKAAVVEQVPLGRMGTTEEVARWVVAVADPGVTWMTGNVLAIDGGMSLT